jgi:membrane protease YdiL (CAAX protease family)
VSPPDQMTPIAYAAAGLQLAFWLAGVCLIWRLVLSPSSRAKRGIRLAEWRLAAIDFACFVCFGFVGCMGVSGIAGLIVRHVRVSQDAVTVLGALGTDGGFLLGVAGFHLLYAARKGGGAGRADVALALRSGFATFLVAMPLVVGASFSWELLITRLGLPDEKQPVVGMFEDIHSVALRWCFVAVAVVLVPVAEEVAFRAGLFRYFRTRMPRWVAIAVTSALFGALHVAWFDHMGGLASFVPLVVLAVVFCLAYERTGSIGTTIVAHALFNLNMLLLILAGVGS